MGGFIYPPFDVYYPWAAVAFLSIYLTYMLIQIETSTSAKQAFKRIFWLSEISYIISFNWLMKPFFFIPENIVLLLLLAPITLFIFSAFLGLFVEFSALITYHAKEKQRYFVFALSLALFEWVRSWIFTGFPWNQLSLVWSDIPVILQMLSLIGPFGLTFITIYILAFPYLLLYKKSFKNIYGISILCISLFTVIFGIFRIYSHKNIASTDLLVRLIDGRIPQPYMSSRHNVEKYQKLAHRDGWKKIDLFVLSESSAPYDLTNNGYYETIYSNINNDKSSLIVGFNRYDNFNEITDDYDIYNTMALVGKNGINYIYDKQHLVPFGEYIPLKKIIPFEKFTEGLKDFSRGQKREAMIVSNMKLLPFICYEIIFSGLSIPQEVDAI
ncbi:MAG: apolipoprotein N-acyltransferase, partial [Alphaproteobacteria bacterium]|nr:apolipoprotein N-acyltransferase [Alphaproteobacteria bacterium]